MTHRVFAHLLMEVFAHLTYKCFTDGGLEFLLIPIYR